MYTTHHTELLERVFLRLGAAESDDKLESCLSRFLTPVVLKINSSHKAVQDKVPPPLYLFFASYHKEKSDC